MLGLGIDAAAQGRGGRGGFNITPLLMETDAFEDGGIIPEMYAGRGGIQPAFTFSNIPEGTETLAIIFHDIDVAFGGTDDVLHWYVWNIPAEAGGIPEGSLPEGTVAGTGGIGRGNYFGPGAPAGPRYHHYVFELYALSDTLDLPETATRDELLEAMNPIVVGLK
jgi:Raf kinase inhibitor-like YbhB/YbcL family protein